MNIYKYDIVFQEVPNHISLAFYVCGCPLKCVGCHSPDLWTEKSGNALGMTLFHDLLQSYKNRISCVLFLGGEWHEAELVEFLKAARSQNLATALYTGLDSVSAELEAELDYLKTGAWIQQRGGLSSPSTNQIFKDLKNNLILNHLFQTHNDKETT